MIPVVWCVEIYIIDDNDEEIVLNSTSLPAILQYYVTPQIWQANEIVKHPTNLNNNEE